MSSCAYKVSYVVSCVTLVPIRVQHLTFNKRIVRARYTSISFVLSNDRQFVAVLYTSESSIQHRYTDDGDIVELCKWTVDLGTLPTFQQQAQLAPGGFYTNFELGLAVDSAGKSLHFRDSVIVQLLIDARTEVQGVLLYNGEEWGRVTFEYLR